MRNPYLNLLGTAWRYAREEKKRYLTVYSFFSITSLINASRPLLYGWFIPGLETQGIAILKHSWMYI